MFFCIMYLYIIGLYPHKLPTRTIRHHYKQGCGADARVFLAAPVHSRGLPNMVNYYLTGNLPLFTAHTRLSSPVINIILMESFIHTKLASIWVFQVFINLSHGFIINFVPGQHVLWASSGCCRGIKSEVMYSVDAIEWWCPDSHGNIFGIVMTRTKLNFLLGELFATTLTN